MNLKSSNKFNKKLLSISSIYWLFNCYLWKTKVGPIFSIGLPFLFMIVYFVVGNRSNSSSFISQLGTYISLCVLPIGLITLPTMNIEFRNSILLRKIKTCNISKIKYNLLLFSFFFLYSLIFICIILFLSFLFNINNLDSFKIINWPTMIYGIFLLIISTLSLGMMLSSFINSYLSSQLIGLTIMLFTLVLSGQFMPLQVIGKVNAIKYISLFSPLSYSANILNIGSNPAANGVINSLFEYSNSFYISNFGENNNSYLEIYYFWQKILFTFGPILFTILFISIGIKTFKWTNR